MPFRSAFSEVSKLLGFVSIKDFMASALGLKSYSWGALKLYLLGTSLTALTAFCAHWLWNPPSALFLLLFVDLTNARYGFQVAKKIKGESFRWDEFKRLGGKLIATIIVLGMVRNAINSYSYYEILADVVFGWLFTTKLQKVVSKMVALKVSEQGLPNVIMASLKWLLSTKMAPFLVDNIQKHPHEVTPHPHETDNDHA